MGRGRLQLWNLSIFEVLQIWNAANEDEELRIAKLGANEAVVLTESSVGILVVVKLLTLLL